ncbi:excinuclease ABC subunit UvrB [[Mycoplasma] testudinis]|uniref:excinuclease ABC subunit UvrB n=1 Tax=[Mycoplasma] testudinis TaxID=33924 RepID=UPI0004873430|nr:excinuclease ABC subunit UvrB [[Mycoplasma] testudinis]
MSDHLSTFKLVSKHRPAGDQPQAIKKLVAGLQAKKRKQVLLGATGTGKTFTIANVIQKVNKPTLVLAHNKTLAAQLYSEFKELFPENAVEYFVSYFDFYQPEAYIPRTDTYIEKSSMTNAEIEMLRLATLNSVSSRKDVIVVASVACIYPSAPPDDFDNFRIILKKGNKLKINELKNKLVHLNYKFNKIDLSPGNFRVNGDVVEIAPGNTDQFHVRLSFFGDELEEIAKIETLTGVLLERWIGYVLGPADEYIMNRDRMGESLKLIEQEMKDRVKWFTKENKLLEAQRIEQRTLYDLESLKEFGFCNGIENYSRHLELRGPGSTPWTLFDYFGDDWLLVVDESHMSIPQVRGMYNTDRSRKLTLIDYGYRLPSAIDNRPLNFQEFEKKTVNTIYVSATPNDWEIGESKNEVVEQIVRPTGLVDPVIEIRTSKNQIDNLISELKAQIAKNERTFITVMTIKMAEDLSDYLKEQNIKAVYLHNELKTLERSLIINDLRRGKYDCIVGINLLREGLDVPEVSLICIFDADKPGFFRSDKSLIQTIGRAARNVKGRVIMYGDVMTEAMKKAIDETNRRRDIQIAFNKKHKITPTTIVKPIYNDLSNKEVSREIEEFVKKKNRSTKASEKLIENLRAEMLQAAKNQLYERAAELRDVILELEASTPKKLNPKSKKIEAN